MEVKILIADDHADIRALMSFALRRAGYEVVEVEDGQAAVAIAAQVKPDAVLLDINMPRLNGLEACRQLRTIPALQTAPILLMTGLGNKTDMLRGIQAGATDYLTKPCMPRELVATLNRLLMA